MMNLDNNPLDMVKGGVDKYNTVKNKINKWILIFTIVKYAAVLIIIGLLIGGGYYILNNGKEMITEAVVSVSEASEGNAVSSGGDNSRKALGSALSKLATNLSESVDHITDGALDDRGFHPDAPSFCLKQTVGTADFSCIDYTDRELDSMHYGWINTYYKGSCPPVHELVKKRLRETGKITFNNKRVFDIQCDKFRSSIENEELIKKKRALLE